MHLQRYIYYNKPTLFYLSADLHITIVQRMKTSSVLEGESCTFECHLSHDLDDEPSWTINGQVVVPNSRIQVNNDGCKYKMTIRNAVLSDAGDVVFTIKDLSCRTMLFVKGNNLTVPDKMMCLCMWYPLLYFISKFTIWWKKQNWMWVNSFSLLQRSRCTYSGTC